MASTTHIGGRSRNQEAQRGMQEDLVGGFPWEIPGEESLKAMKIFPYSLAEELHFPALSH